MTAVRRIGKELNDLNSRPVSGITVTAKEDNMMVWHGNVKGPVDSPYKGGTFHFTVTFPDNFPFKPPAVVFSTKIYHPGFNEEGHICLAMLRDEWKPAITMKKGTFGAYKIGKPSPDDPFDTEIAAVLKEDEAKFKTTAKEWTKK
ncbi:hypothetical protein FRB99_007315 [Tulasnella sp. 403]|nr:hypothetical protein FRB99_007315 [Tulasnella sp. 403]